MILKNKTTSLQKNIKKEKKKKDKYHKREDDQNLVVTYVH